ncbi:hypothetical protein BKA83DRAFT_2532300 [Pisolithus microcarpus]|nr:hypothetical protein BKA83DRAFT_2532300 [Pisolithus microcarpus]
MSMDAMYQDIGTAISAKAIIHTLTPNSQMWYLLYRCPSRSSKARTIFASRVISFDCSRPDPDCSTTTQQRQPRRRCQQEQLYALLKSRLSQRCAKLENARWSPLDEGSGNLGTLLGSRVYLEVHASNIPVGKVCTDQRSAPAWLWEVRHVCDETVFHATVQPSRIWFGEVMGPTSFTVLLPTFPIRPYMRALKALVRGKVNLRLMPSASEYTQKSCELLRRTARWGFEKHHGT